MGIITQIRKKIPKYVKNQVERFKEAAIKILNLTAPKHGSKIVIMDDDTYCYKDSSQIPGLRYVQKLPSVELPDSLSPIPKGKFEKKFGVWQAISSNGLISPPVVIEKNTNAKDYLELCLKKVLLPLIESNFVISDCIFWPDLANYHYAGEVKKFFDREKLKIYLKR